MLKDTDELQVECSIALRRLKGMLPMIDDLVDSRQTRVFVTPDTREAAGRELRAFRKARIEAMAAGYPGTVTPGRLPGNAAVWELTADIDFTLIDVMNRITKACFAQGICITRAARVIAPRATLFANVAELLWWIPTRVCGERVLRDLAWLVERADRLVDGEDRVEMRATCPWCGERSLVWYADSGLIRCERPRQPDGTRTRCRCGSPDCGCWDDPRHVHSWVYTGERRRHRNEAGSWNGLLAMTRHQED